MRRKSGNIFTKPITKEKLKMSLTVIMETQNWKKIGQYIKTVTGFQIFRSRV